MMRLETLPGLRAGRPWKLKFPIRDAPHATIETNKTCNLRCRSCYSLERSVVKSRRQIDEEIDLALQKRKAGTITLLGGEPTLHPELAAVVAGVKSRGLRCQILTNGLRFLDPDGGALLDRLAAAGVDRIFVHIDEGQTAVHRDIDAARRAVFDKLERRRIRFGLSLTIYPDTQGRIPGLIQTYADYRHFDSVLAVLARDPVQPEPDPPDLSVEAESFVREIDAAPSAYVPSNFDDGDVRWLVYFLFHNRRSGGALSLSPQLYGLIAGLYRLALGRRLYAPFLSPRAAAPLAVLAAIAETVMGKRRLLDAFRFFRGRKSGRRLGFRFVAVQTPPEFAAGNYRLCYACPDATIRNGKLTPVCIADRTDPLNGVAERSERNRIRAAVAYAHLGEPSPDLLR